MFINIVLVIVLLITYEHNLINATKTQLKHYLVTLELLLLLTFYPK